MTRMCRHQCSLSTVKSVACSIDGQSMCHRTADKLQNDISILILFFFTLTILKIRLNVIAEALLILENNISARLKFPKLSQIQKSGGLVCAKTF